MFSSSFFHGLQLTVLVAHIAIVLFSTASCVAAIRVEAYRGEPFGIGRVSIDLRHGSSSVPWNDDRFALTEANNRVLYPVIENRPAGRILRGLLGIESPWRVTFIFMFRGDDPLALTAYTPDSQRFTVRPENDAEEFHELLDDWWDASKNRYQQVHRQAKYPLLVENYLLATWARRLDREMPQTTAYLLRPFRWGDPWLSQLLGTEAYQAEIERELLLGRLGAPQEATIPLPKNSVSSDPHTTTSTAVRESEVETLPTPDLPLANALEPIADHVPRECFYLRFANFRNYLWFRDFLRHWQGDLTNMLVMQGVNHRHSDRFQQQIAVGETKIARIMGPAIIRDVAIIGFDFYLRDGAAMGILFHANNNALLRANLNEQRQQAMSRHKDAKAETEQIAGHEVSVVTSPDGRLRSFYAIDGDFHLVTNCRRLAERFLEAGNGIGSLAATPGFQAARAAMPLEREDTIFLHISAEFFENLAGPHYRVELDRRLRSIGEIRALKLAQLAAKAEGRDASSIDDLIQADLLPSGFDQRADGSRLVVSDGGKTAATLLRSEELGTGEADVALHEYHDSLRGKPGWMVPIADVAVERITESEARRYQAFQRNLAASVGRFSPISVALKQGQSPAASNWDRITADIRIAPSSQMPIARWPNMLGPAARIRLAPIQGDVASLELVIDALGEPVHLFAGLRDFRTPLVVREGEVQADAPTGEYMRAYVGAWPRPHLLDRFLGRPSGPYDDDGIARTRGLFDLWFRRADDFFLFSFKRDVLLEVGPQLAMVETEVPAQIRLRIDDLSNKQIAEAVSALGYMQARDASASAARFMNTLSTQLHIPPEVALPVAEDLVGGTFTCPLGGQYVLIDPASNNVLRHALPNSPRNAEELPPPDSDPARQPDDQSQKLWVSTAPSPENRFLLTVLPAEYRMPLSQWFRGLTAEVARVNDELTLHAVLDMTHLEIRPPEDSETESGGGILPGLRNLFGGSEKNKVEQAVPASATKEREDGNK